VSALAFTLTPANEAGAPPSERDEVRLMVAERGRPLVHDMFRGLPGHLRPGDLLVVNTSATMPAALPAGELTLHLSTPVPNDAER
jgi:S-adenosylmethionine:tRNA ribosyltransferase-isomerase